MDLTPELQEIIKKAIEAHGSINHLAKSLHIAHSTILFWQGGKTAEISGYLWAQRVRPLLAEYMTPEQRRKYRASLPKAPSSIKKEAGSALAIKSQCLEAWDKAIESLEEFATSQRQAANQIDIALPDGIWIDDRAGLIEGLPAGTQLKLDSKPLPSAGKAAAILITTISKGRKSQSDIHFGTYERTDGGVSFIKNMGNALNLKKLSAEGNIKTCLRIEMIKFT